ncbi:alpha/beta fold hydrolase [Maribacter halichondriae]|uniref:alpha/beta fold hydrolase n=1 Tax=Maribacter halichondriae TaxID=2980554 RepID=UPI00235A33F4|nr:alpha/beta hydrolase [Maribacter sp. Hal144]
MNTLKKVIISLMLVTAIGAQAQNRPFEVVVQGEGQPILLFPGFTCTADVWNETVNELSKNYECHIFTFAGFGEVPPIEKPWLPEIKEGIEAYVESLNLQNPVIIGHSLGGALALWLASEENSPYQKLIIVDALPATGALMMPNFKSENIVYDNPYNQQLLEMDEDSFGQMASQMAAGMTLNKEKQAQIKDWMIQSDRETYVYGYTDLLKLDLREDLSKITIPVMILAATDPMEKKWPKKRMMSNIRT